MKQNTANDLTALYAEKYKRAKLKTLVFDRYKDPFMVFKDFFSVDDINGHLACLKKLYKCAISLRAIKTGAADAIYGTELFSKVLNAAWVIDQTGIRFSQIHDKKQYAGMSGGELNNKKINHLLTIVEINDPYLAIKNVYDKKNLGQCHLALNSWLKTGLCKNEMEEDYRGRRKLYKSIVKILICIWLIYEREILSSTNSIN